MAVEQRLSEVRRLVRDRLSALSGRDIRESILLRGQEYAGHRFECEELRADWLLGSTSIDICCGERVMDSVVLPRDAGNSRAA